MRVAEFETSSRLRRRAGLERLGGLLEELRAFGELREVKPGTFMHGSHPLLHFHYHSDGQIVADIRRSDGRVTRFDVSDKGGQQEVLSVVEGCLDHAT